MTARWRRCSPSPKRSTQDPFSRTPPLGTRNTAALPRRVALASNNVAQQAGLDPTVAGIILGGKAHSSVDTFRAAYRLAEPRRAADPVLASVDALALPTAGTVYSVAEVQADPVGLNSNLGWYTNFMNLLDLCGLAVPASQYSAGPGFGITLIAPAWHDEALLALGARYLEVTRLRLYALANTTPPKPGLVRCHPGDSGAAIAVETYALAPDAFGRFVEAVPEPLVIGTATLADGTRVKSFLCEPRALAGATDITTYAGWTAYLQTRR